MVLDTRHNPLSGMFSSRNAGSIESVVIAPTLPKPIVAPAKQRKPRKTRKTKSSQPRITHCPKSPITVWYSARGVTPTRSVTYRAVTVLADFGFAAIGTINYAGETRYVERTNGAWELSCPIVPYIGSK